MYRSTQELWGPRHGSRPPCFSHVRLARLPWLTNVTLCAHERVAPLASTCVYVRSSGATEQVPEMYFHEGAEDPRGKQLILREEKPDGLCAEPSVKMWSSEERTPVPLRLMSCPWTLLGRGESSVKVQESSECKSACMKRAFPWKLSKVLVVLWIG